MRTRQPLISMRLWDNHLNPNTMSENLALMLRRRGACDEVWFATDYGFPPLSVHQEHAKIMAEAAAQVREAGIAASLQISNTIGHGAYLLFMDFQGFTDPMVGHDGVAAPCCSCPRASDFLAYLDAYTRAYCAWQPDRLWIDDDLRLHHHNPVDFGCFCGRCLAEFSAVTSHIWKREELVRAINDEQDLSARGAWMQFCRDSAAGVARTVARAAIAVAPECQLGSQHCDLSFSGYNGSDWHHVLCTLHEISGRPVGSRPGGGFYHDHQPREVLYKALMTGHQNSRLPDCAELVSYECENLPGSVIGKSARGTAVECTLAISQGCNSLSLTPLMFQHESEWHETMMMEIEAWRPFWERYVAANIDTRGTGVEVVFGKHDSMRKLLPDEAPFAWSSVVFDTMTPTAVLGLPLCWNEHAPAAWLSAPAARGVDEAELRLLMKRGLLVDGEAIEILEQRELSHILGVRFAPISFPFSNLKLTDDPINGPFVNTTLVCGCFMFGKPRSIEVIDGNARCLSRYAHFYGDEADAEAVLIENSDGGRLAIFGWGVGNPTVTTARRHQILAAANWVSQDRLPAWLETPCQVVVIPRCNELGQLKTLLLLNVSLDHTPALTLKLADAEIAGTWTWMRPLEQDLAVPSSERIKLPPLAPWNLGVLCMDSELAGKE